MIPSDEYASRRKLLFSKMKDNSACILFSGQEITKSASSKYPFFVNRNFYYLTGICQDNCILLLIKSASELKEFLFIEENNEAKEKFTGKRLSFEKAEILSGIQNCLLISSFNSRINFYLSPTNLVDALDTLYLDEYENVDLKIFDNMYLKDYSATIFNEYPNVEIVDIHDTLAALRNIKSNLEVNEIKEAVRRNIISMQATMKEIRPNQKLYELGIKYINSSLENNEYEDFPADPVLAINKDACILKNRNYAERLGIGDLVLLEGCATSNLYNSRLCRVYPSGGTFDNVQKKIYGIVLKCENVLINSLNLGVPLSEIQAIGYQFLARECQKEGLINKPEDIKKHIYHNLIQNVGLDIPDLGNKNQVIEKGNILSISPGLYFPSLNIGIRLSDMVYVNGKGNEILSNSLIKEIDEIEQFYRGN